jgi:hypothetical protein
MHTRGLIVSMPMRPRPLAVLVLVAATLTSASAQTLSGIRLDPAEARPGQAVRVTVSFEPTDLPNCNVRLHFGDGRHRDFKINQGKDMPLVTSITWDKPGSYQVKAEGKTALPVLKCTGANQLAMVRVAAPAGASPRGPACPAGWKLDAASVNRKTGAFTCKAAAGTAPPAGKLDCAPPLGYFENRSRGQVGCRP